MRIPGGDIEVTDAAFSQVLVQRLLCLADDIPHCSRNFRSEVSTSLLCPGLGILKLL